MNIKKGDLLGINEGEWMHTLVVAEIIREDRFLYCWSIQKKKFKFVVYDPEYHFVICPGFNTNIEADLDFYSDYKGLYDALDRLFGFEDDSTDEIVDITDDKDPKNDLPTK